MPSSLSRRQKVMLAALGAEEGAAFGPAQVQKFFFLLDQNVAKGLGGKLFDFEPYDYGPFDKSVYSELDTLEQKGFVQKVQMHPGPAGRRYMLTPSGLARGREEAEKLPEKVSNYMLEVAKWVRNLSFAELVGSIYKAYPDMRARSIFVDGAE